MFGLFNRKESKSLDKLIIQVIDFSDDENYLEAIRICDEIIKIDPNYDRVYFERAMVFLNQEKPKLAIKDFKKLLKLNPDYPGGKEWYATTLAELGDKNSAAFTQFEALKLQPEGNLGMGVSPNSWSDCAQSFIDAKDFKKAEIVLTEYFDHFEKNVTNYKSDETAPIRTMAKLLLKLKEPVKALEFSIRGFESPNKVPADYEVLIETYIENDQMKKARELIDNYVNDIHEGFITENIEVLKNKLK
ncbi:tetratricopeptide repeat protein [Spongiimicrobium salis]|uniref:tetratricopeptide repeat protein n=1 Tax=Spongiimicrobium salis TaxID=1667022 RepID=UPI00374D99A3